MAGVQQGMEGGTEGGHRDGALRRSGASRPVSVKTTKTVDDKESSHGGMRPGRRGSLCCGLGVDGSRG